jgi:hypothetical protein
MWKYYGDGIAPKTLQKRPELTAEGGISGATKMLKAIPKGKK